MEPRPHKQWHSRGYVPHLDRPGLLQVITFRLHDSLPRGAIERWRAEMRCHGEVAPNDPIARALRERIAAFEDAGHGACWLRQELVAQIVEDALLRFDGERYRLIAWCIMPNHVHALIEAVRGCPQGGVVQGWKSFTAKEANKALGRHGQFWAADYYDRFVRDQRHLAAVVEYIERNPVAAGLVGEKAAWRWGSAWSGRRGG